YVLGFHERLERLARAHRRWRNDDEPVDSAAHDIELGRGHEHGVELGSERVDEQPQLAASLAKRLRPRARPAAAPVADRGVDLVPGMERAVAYGDHEALEPGADIPAGLPGQKGHRRVAA